MSADRKLFDREVQRRILELARDAYPAALNAPKSADFGMDNDGLLREVTYLKEHGLLDIRVTEYSETRQLREIKITARGIDFLADDGGLTAILGVVTVRLDTESIQQLLLQRVDESNESDSVKSQLKRQIKALPAEAVKALTTAGLKEAMKNLPHAIEWLRTVLAAVGP